MLYYKTYRHVLLLQGAQAFPGTFHICGDNYPDAAGRVSLNREFSARQLSATAQLAVDVFTWDCTRLPLRDACGDVIVSDLVGYVRLVSAAESAAPRRRRHGATTPSVLCCPPDCGEWKRRPRSHGSFHTRIGVMVLLLLMFLCIINNIKA